jgi:hypothetical protein
MFASFQEDTVLYYQFYAMTTIATLTVPAHHAHVEDSLTMLGTAHGVGGAVALTALQQGSCVTLFAPKCAS